MAEDTSYKFKAKGMLENLPSLQHFHNLIDNFTMDGQIEVQMANITIHTYRRSVSLIIKSMQINNGFSPLEAIKKLTN